MASPRALHAAKDWLHAHRPGPNAVKVVGAFAGGAVFTAVVVISWYGSWSGMRSDDPPRAQSARVIPQPVTQARQTPCERQAWPYVEQRCQEEDGNAASAAPRQRIRVVSPDNRTISSATLAVPMPAKSDTPASPVKSALVPSDKSAEVQLTPQQPATSNKLIAPEVTPAVAIAVSREPAGTARESVPLPPESPQRPDTTASIPTPPVARPASEPARREPAPTVAADNHEPSNTTLYASTQQADTRRGSKTAKRRQWQGQDDRAEVVGRRGREVTVVRTYELADGRRVTVTRTYRNAPESVTQAYRNVPDRTLHEEAALYRRPFAGYQYFAPRGYAGED